MERTIKTDVLIIGGGMAGCFAAVKAKEKGVNVTLVDKGYVGRTGQTPKAAVLGVFNPEWGHKLEDWMEQTSMIGEYLNNREWNRIVFEESHDRYLDLVSWGVKFHEENGEVVRGPHPHGAPSEVVFWDLGRGPNLRNAIEGAGVNVMDRIMIVDLIKNGDTVVGAIGISVKDRDLYIFKAKATVISAGASGLKSPGWPNHEITADGEAMAYRAGCEITGKEFYDTHYNIIEYPYFGNWPRPESAKEHSEHVSKLVKNRKESGSMFKIRNAEGDEVPIRGKGWLMDYELEWEAHAGRAPLTIDSETLPQSYFENIERPEEVRVIGGAATGMSIHATAGIWPSNTKCAAKGLSGLYAAGDSLGARHCGAHYSGFGFALIFAAVSGARAGWGAAEYALEGETPTVNEEELKRLKEIARMPLEREGGFSPRWVTSLLQSYMKPYFILGVKHEDRLEATLTQVEFIRDHLVPKLKANNPHELRLAHETKNMALSSEMMIRASLFRTESRGAHYREDYPQRNDPEWLAWVKLKKGQDGMEVLKEPVPKEWWPDLSKPYEKRYPMRFPKFQGGDSNNR